jgi:excisionase family DNA binding protein
MTEHPLPPLLTAKEAGALLRTSRKAVYSMVERGQLPGVIRLGRRLLIRTRDLLDFLDHNRTPSPQENMR